MSYVSILVHCVWSTWKRAPLLDKKYRYQIFRHLQIRAKENGIWVDMINGYSDHIHCLISLQPDQKLSYIIQLMKGESALWINQNIPMDQYFRWGRGYYAKSVGDDQLPILRRYIERQEAHHVDVSWASEERRYRKEINALNAPFCRLPPTGRSS